jgi:L-lactate dehydrogenase
MMKVGIVGSGLVGSAAAYALVMQGVGREIVLVDANKLRAEAEADDIFHAVPFANPLEIRDGDYADLRGCKAVVVTAGVNQRPGETRLQLLQRNAAVFREVIPRIVEHARDAILIVATNPVDIMTHLAIQIATEAGVAEGRVIGSGTTLDTARYRTLLGRHFGVDSRHVHAYVIGEHGDSEVLVWSQVTIAGMSLDEFVEARGVPLYESDMATIDTQVRRAAYHIIEGKGATYFGIGAALARIVDVILHDQRSIMTICSRHTNLQGVPDVTMATPHLFGGDGVIMNVPMKLTESESEAFRRSASVIRAAIDSLS